MEDEMIRGPEPYPAEVVSVEPLENYKLRIKLTDGRKGIFDVSPYLDMGVFQELRDPQKFRCAYIEYGTVVWPNEIDIAPDTIEALLQPEPASDKSSLRVAENRKKNRSKDNR